MADGRGVALPDGVDADDLVDDVVVVLLAGGSGERLGSGRPKAFVGLGGQVMVAWSLQAFESHPAVDSIVLVVPEGWKGPAESLIDDLGCDKVSAIEVGGTSRAASVLAGLRAVLPRRQTAVLVHDAARPDVPEALIDAVLVPLSEGWDCAVPALPVLDTAKRIDPATGAVLETVDRATLVLAQTPQCCRASVLVSALGATEPADLERVTDCAAAIEAAGGRVVTVTGDHRAAKVTTPDDLLVAQARLAPAGSTDAEQSLAQAPVGELEDDDLEPLDADDLAGGSEEPTGGPVAP